MYHQALGLLTISKVDERLWVFARRHSLQAVLYAQIKTKNFHRADASFFSIRRVHHDKIG